MSKMILTGLSAFAALGLAACGERAEENNIAVENVEDLNATTDMNMDMDMNAATDMNAANDMNMTDNAMGNESTNNSTGY